MLSQSKFLIGCYRFKITGFLMEVFMWGLVDELFQCFTEYWKQLWHSLITSWKKHTTFQIITHLPSGLEPQSHTSVQWKLQVWSNYVPQTTLLLNCNKPISRIFDSRVTHHFTYSGSLAYKYHIRAFQIGNISYLNKSITATRHTRSLNSQRALFSNNQWSKYWGKPAP